MEARSTAVQIPWRFGDRPEDADAWLTRPDMLHVYVDFQSPDTPKGRWHRVMCVTQSWLRKQAATEGKVGFYPSMIVVADGARADIEAAISGLLANGGWRIVIDSASLLPAGHKPTEW